MGFRKTKERVMICEKTMVSAKNGPQKLGDDSLGSASLCLLGYRLWGGSAEGVDRNL